MTKTELETKLAASGWRLAHYQEPGPVEGSSYAGRAVEAAASYRAVKDLPNGGTAEASSRSDAEELLVRVASWEALQAARKKVSA